MGVKLCKRYQSPPWPRWQSREFVCVILRIENWWKMSKKSSKCELGPHILASNCLLCTQLKGCPPSLFFWAFKWQCSSTNSIIECSLLLLLISNRQLALLSLESSRHSISRIENCITSCIHVTPYNPPEVWLWDNCLVSYGLDIILSGQWTQVARLFMSPRKIKQSAWV